MIAFWAFIIWLIVWLIKQNKWTFSVKKKDHVQNVEIVKQKIKE